MLRVVSIVACLAAFSLFGEVKGDAVISLSHTKVGNRELWFGITLGHPQPGAEWTRDELHVSSSGVSPGAVAKAIPFSVQNEKDYAECEIRGPGLCKGYEQPFTFYTVDPAGTGPDSGRLALSACDCHGDHIITCKRGLGDDDRGPILCDPEGVSRDHSCVSKTRQW